MAWIYILENKINGKTYVGQTINIKRRFNHYKYHSKRYVYPIYNAIRKYGFDNFNKYVFSGIPEELLDYFEIELMGIL